MREKVLRIVFYRKNYEALEQVRILNETKGSTKSEVFLIFRALELSGNFGAEYYS